MTSTTETPSFSLQTLASLTPRLQRLEFLLTGSSRWDGVPIPPPQSSGGNKIRREDTAVYRLHELQKSFDQLKRREEVRGILGIYERHPDLFPTDSSSHSSPPENLPDLRTLATILLSSAPLIQTIAFQLTALSDLANSSSLPPPPSQSFHLLSSGPSVSVLHSSHDRLACRVAALRERTARLLERWVQVSVVGMGECWVEWEERVRECERQVRRRERRREEKRREERRDVGRRGVRFEGMEEEGG